MATPGPELSQYQPGDPRLPQGDRGSKLLAPLRAEGGKSVAIAVVSTIVFFVVLSLIVVNSPGWDEVKRAFFSRAQFKESFPSIVRAFLVNVRLFMISEVLILALALVVAVMRSLPGPVFFPIRVFAMLYTDLFRGVPTILVIYLLGFGVPALGIQGVPDSPFLWGVVSLVLVYSAYVAEVYRAGIESVHGSQVAAARSLGLSRGQSMRFVILPQAVRRVIPPLLNDFIGLQKDTVLVSYIGVVEAFRTAGIDSARTFNFTPYVALAVVYLVITVPMTRFVDAMVARDRGRRQAGGAL
ncbi:MAG: amino acid ABC transporter permease [Actinomycetota bacterium]